MKKKEWGNAVWLLFHTLAFKLKDEYISELPILISNISSICNHLPCPDCQQHATSVMNNINKAHLSSSKNTLINFLWEFHNHVNKNLRKDIFEYSHVDELYSELDYKCDRIHSKYGIDIPYLLEKGEIYTFVDSLK